MDFDWQLKLIMTQSSGSCVQNSGRSSVLSAESLRAGSSGEFEEGLGGVEAGETVTIEDSIEDGGKTCREVGESLLGVTFGEAI